MAVTPPYGLLAFGTPPAAGDDRYWDLPPAAAEYEVVADASFADGTCHKFATIAQEDLIPLYFNGCGSGAGQGIDMAVGQEFRFYAETEWARTGLAALTCTRIAGGASAGVRVVLNTGKLYARGFIAQANGTESVTSDYEISASGTATYREIEWGIKRSATTEYQLTLRIDGVQKEVLTRTMLDSSNIAGVSNIVIGHLADSGKAVTCDIRFGRYAVSWNDGTISRNDQQWYTDWAPTVIGEDYPTSDVTSPDEWTGTGDATNLFNNINDDPYDNTTRNTVSVTTAKAEMLLGWPNIGTLAASPVVVLATGRGSGATAAHQFISKQGSTYKRTLAITAPPHGAVGSVVHGVFLTDPDDAVWTEPLIDSADYGVDKAATAGSTDASVYELWRYVLHGGNDVPPPPVGAPDVAVGTQPMPVALGGGIGIV